MPYVVGITIGNKKFNMGIKTKASKNYPVCISDLCQLPLLTLWDDKMKTPHVSHEILEINYKPHLCLHEFHQIPGKTTP